MDGCESPRAVSTERSRGTERLRAASARSTTPLAEHGFHLRDKGLRYVVVDGADYAGPLRHSLSPPIDTAGDSSNWADGRIDTSSITTTGLGATSEPSRSRSATNSSKSTAECGFWRSATSCHTTVGKGTTCSTSMNDLRASSMRMCVDFSPSRPLARDPVDLDTGACRLGRASPGPGETLRAATPCEGCSPLRVAAPDLPDRAESSPRPVHRRALTPLRRPAVHASLGCRDRWVESCSSRTFADSHYGTPFRNANALFIGRMTEPAGGPRGRT